MCIRYKTIVRQCTTIISQFYQDIFDNGFLIGICFCFDVNDSVLFVAVATRLVFPTPSSPAIIMNSLSHFSMSKSRLEGNEQRPPRPPSQQLPTHSNKNGLVFLSKIKIFGTPRQVTNFFFVIHPHNLISNSPR